MVPAMAAPTPQPAQASWDLWFLLFNSVWIVHLQFILDITPFHLQVPRHVFKNLYTTDYKLGIRCTKGFSFFFLFFFVVPRIKPMGFILSYTPAF